MSTVVAGTGTWVCAHFISTSIMILLQWLPFVSQWGQDTL